MNFKLCYMLLFKKTIKKIIDKRIAEIERLKKYTGENELKYAITNLKGLKKDLG